MITETINVGKCDIMISNKLLFGELIWLKQIQVINYLKHLLVQEDLILDL